MEFIILRHLGISALEFRAMQRRKANLISSSAQKPPYSIIKYNPRQITQALAFRFLRIYFYFFLFFTEQHLYMLYIFQVSYILISFLMLSILIEDMMDQQAFQRPPPDYTACICPKFITSVKHKVFPRFSNEDFCVHPSIYHLLLNLGPGCGAV